MLLSSSMSATPQFATAVYGLAAVVTWGTSDFLGGYATRRANAFLFSTVVNIGGLLLVGTLASTTHAAFPSLRSVLWVLAGGASGGASLAIFYRALASGRMGLTAPVAAVFSAAIPTIFSMFTEGVPGKIPVVGFFLAAIGLWLITRAEDGNTPEGIGLALLAGTGFAVFYLCVRQASDGSAFWIATFTRTGCKENSATSRLQACVGAYSRAASTRSERYCSCGRVRRGGWMKRWSSRHSIPP
jgi:uncharacterized membrane protein